MICGESRPISVSLNSGRHTVPKARSRLRPLMSMPIKRYLEFRSLRQTEMRLFAFFIGPHSH